MKNIVAIRTDGFGQRLKVIISAMQIAVENDLLMRFLWDVKAGEHGKFHSCEPVEEIFSKEFISKHYLGKKPSGPDFYKIKNLIDSEESSILLSREVGLKPSQFFELFENVGFSSKMKNAIALARKVPLSGASGLHLRGGDILYGPLRRFSTIHQGRIIPLPIAKVMVNSEPRKQWIIFAQDEPVQKVFEKYENVISSSAFHDKLESNAEKFIFDVVLMSRCEQIFGGHSAICEMASLLSGIKTNFIDKFFSEQEIVDIIKNDNDYACGNYDNFIMSQLNSSVYYYLKDKFEKSFFIDQALKFDSNNNGLILLRDLNFIDQGDLNTANTYIEEKMKWLNTAAGSKKLAGFLKDAKVFFKSPSIFNKALSPEIFNKWARSEYFFVDLIFAYIRFTQGNREFLDEVKRDPRAFDFSGFFDIIEEQKV